MKRKEQKAPQGPYSWYRRKFRRACVQLCEHDGWQGWRFSRLFTNDVSDFGFPMQGSAAEKLAFIDLALAQKLQSDDDDEGKDLNPYREWALKHVLHEIKKRSESTGPLPPYLFPEDLPKLAADIRLYDGHYKGPATSLTDLPDLATLREKTKPFRHKHNIKHDELHLAHAAHLDVAPEILQTLLPKDWIVSDTNVETPEGLLIERQKGGAALITKPRLADGTLIVQPLTEAASIAYGSPEWCTARRKGETDFYEYEDDLLIVIKPDGERFQISFEMQQWMDSNDDPIDLMRLDQETPGLLQACEEQLRRAIYMAWISSINNDIDYIRFASGIPSLHTDTAQLVRIYVERIDNQIHGPNSDFLRVFDQHVRHIPEWKEEATKGIARVAETLAFSTLIPLAELDPDWAAPLVPHVQHQIFDSIDEGNDCFVMEDYLKMIAKIPALRAEGEKYIGQAAVAVIDEGGSNGNLFFKFCATIPEWNVKIAQAIPEIHARAGEIDESNGSTATRNRIERCLACDPDWSRLWTEQTTAPHRAPKAPPAVIAAPSAQTAARPA